MWDNSSEHNILVKIILHIYRVIQYVAVTVVIMGIKQDMMLQASISQC